MTTLTGVSMKKRRAAALQWSRWRNAGYAHEVSALQAFVLTGLPAYRNMHPDKTVRLTAVAIDYITKGGSR